MKLRKIWVPLGSATDGGEEESPVKSEPSKGDIFRSTTEQTNNFHRHIIDIEIGNFEFSLYVPPTINFPAKIQPQSGYAMA